MGTVLFVPNLLGPNALQAEFVGRNIGNADVAKLAANQKGWAFKKLDYQHPNNPTPFFYEMEATVLNQLEDILNAKPKESILAIGDTFGFGILTGALSRLGQHTSRIALLGIKPVIDPLQAVAQKVNHSDMQLIRLGMLNKLLIHIEGSDGLKDKFAMSSAHYKDDMATRLLTNPEHMKRFANASSNICASTLVYGQNDPLTPSAVIEQFSNAVKGAKTRLIELNTNHFAMELDRRTSQMIEEFPQLR